MIGVYVVKLKSIRNAAPVKTGELGMNMNRLVLAASAVLSLSVVGSANAADMGMPAMPTKAPIMAPVFNWTGFYIGGNVGGGWGNQSATSTTTSLIGVDTFSGSSTSSGALGGGQIGFNYEFPNQWVIGLEADGDWANIAGTASGCSTYTSSLFPTFYPVGSTSACGTNSGALNDFGTVRGRLGYAWNNVLLYGTGGWAWGNDSGTHTTTCVGAACPGTTTAFTGGGFTYSNSLSGWTAGAGIEWGFLPNWTVRVEYLHLEFDNVGTNFAGTISTAKGTNPFTGNTSSNGGVDLVRVGLNYLFNWGSAPGAFR
jgi:outer membrane immunogenic protein